MSKLDAADVEYLYGEVECPHPRCQAELYLNFSASVPISPSDLDDNGSTVTAEDGVTSRWDVACTDGHTIVQSHELHGDADDHDFSRQDWLYVATIVERLRSKA